MSIDFQKAHHPTLKTYEEFISFLEKDTEENRTLLWKQYQFATKERDRLREKDRRRREKEKEEKAKLPPIPRKKPGPKGPWKHKRLASDNSLVPGAGELPK